MSMDRHAVLKDRKGFMKRQIADNCEIVETQEKLGNLYKTFNDQDLIKTFTKLFGTKETYNARTVLDQVFIRYLVEADINNFVVSVLVVVYHKLTQVQLVVKKVLAPTLAPFKVSLGVEKVAVSVVLKGFMDVFNSDGRVRFYTLRHEDSYSCVQYGIGPDTRAKKSLYYSSFSPMYTPSSKHANVCPPVVVLTGASKMSGSSSAPTKLEEIPMSVLGDKLLFRKLDQYGSFLPPFDSFKVGAKLIAGYLNNPVDLPPYDPAKPPSMENLPEGLGSTYLLVQDGDIWPIDLASPFILYRRGSGDVTTPKGVFKWGEVGEIGTWCPIPEKRFFV